NAADPDVAPRVAALLVLALYLGSDWLRTESDVERLKSWYWVADAFHVAAIVWLAIALQERSHDLTLPLASVFLVTVFWHIVGAWEPVGTRDRVLPKRFALAALNALGLLLLLGLPALLGKQTLWPLSISLLAVVALWSVLRRRVYPKT